MFSLPNNATLLNMDYQFDMYVVIFSILAAGIGAFTALSCNARVGPHSLISKKVWLFLASLAMGLGIWSMHFIGMSAIDLGVHVSHNLILTIISFIPAFVASLLAFSYVNQPRRSKKLYIVAAILMGLGISCMHYIGMYAMTTSPIYFYYNPLLFITSIIVAMVVSYVALYIFSNVQTYMLQVPARIGTSIVLACAVASMHYIGMYAMRFYVTDESLLTHGLDGTMDMTSMAVIRTFVTISIILILFLFVITTIVDRYIEIRVSHFDPLTKLPNRRVFQSKIEKKEVVYSVAIWQFQDMEIHNQEYGYLFVDRLINHIANFLKKYTPPMTDLYRGESNRFTFVTKDRDAAIELQGNLSKLATIFKDDFQFEEKDIALKGVCAYIQCENGEQLRKPYSNAMAILKHPSIEYNFEIIEYNPKFHTRNFTEEILDNFEDALANHDIFIVYQPKINVFETKAHSVEALIRWQHPIHGFLSPGIFLPILEANDLMNDLTDWIIEQVCIQLKKWEVREEFPKQVAINIPGPYLTSTRLLAVLSTLTKKYKVDTSAIELEITETSFVKTITSAEKSVRQYRAEGFSVALDDFGTGVSSLSYLKRIPISTLKIDKSFIDDVPASEKDNSILQSMIQLARSLNMKVVVEGIETIEQVNYLTKECGSPSMQGFYFAKPMQAGDLEEWCIAYPITLKESVPLE